MLDPDGPGGRQVGSAFLNPTVTPDQAARSSAAECPVHTGPDGRWRIHCSQRCTLAIAARNMTTVTTSAQVLADSVARVEDNAGISLHPEPVRVDQRSV
ncbi:hypothetical protein DR950_33865 [Kitasatospora xanthocidica]|uniref:Uncharacterized protein n=1 Tax=Kitasatospora xanthocidica TaxID=83382 RepID=A0A373A1S2_9ACTN|nr:hypothetical protein DR950_33865 [Kitasatospora xanthocidica]